MNTITDSIFHGKDASVPLADVQHLERRANGILAVMKSTRYNYEMDEWDNAVHFGKDECDELLRAWCAYRSEIGGAPVLPTLLGPTGPRMPKPCTALEALDYAIEMCHLRKSNIRSEGWNAACSDIAVFVAAARERIEQGLELRDHAVTQNIS